MKKKIVSIISALVLTCAMSLNVAAAGSVTAADVAAAAGDVAVPTVEKSVDVAEEIIVSGATVGQLDNADAKVLAEEAAKLNSEDAVESVTVFAMVDLDGTPGKVVVKMALNGNESAYALHSTANGVERIVGVNNGDGTVAFDFDGFSPVAIMKVTFKTNNTATSAASTTTTTTTTEAAAGAAVAPKTGDMAMMVSVMAVIFMAGAAVAVFMSKKRA